MRGKLILVPTPLGEDLPLEPVALELLQKVKGVVAVEELKPGRRRWLSWGLPRESIEHFVEFNEHTQKEQTLFLLQKLKEGQDVYLMSDGGLPAFCDPGRELVYACHQQGIQVSATPFPHSISLALALSGFFHRSFFFAGFPPREKNERIRLLQQTFKRPETLILMDAPYRLHKLLEECEPLRFKREVLLAMDLNLPTEELFFFKAGEPLQRAQEKREFILVFSAKDFQD